MAHSSHKAVEEEMIACGYGYIRRIERKYKHLNIPMGIKDICLDFYLLFDFFAIHGDKITLNKDRNIATGTTTETTPNNVYGNEIVDLYDKSILHYRWRFKIYHIDYAIKLHIGLCDADEEYDPCQDR